MPERRRVPFGKDGPGISSEIQVYFFDSTDYDRYLETHPGHKTIALAYEFQILHELPAEPYDKSVDMIVTEKRVIRCSIK